MKITKDNLQSEYDNYKDYLRDDEMREKVRETFDLIEFYGEDDDITQAVDAICGMVNKFIAKNAPTTPKQPQKTEPNKIIIATVPKPKKEKTPKTPKSKKEPKQKAPKQIKKEDNNISTSVKIIKRFALLNGKTYTGKVKEKAIMILHALQKAILAHDIRKTDPYATEIEKIQDNLLTLINNRASGQVIKIADIDHLREIGNSYVVSPIVRLLQSYVRLVGKDGVKTQAKKLLEQFNAVNKGSYTQQANDAIESLQRYIDDKTTVVTASQEMLEGLYGLCGIDAPQIRAHSMSAAELGSTFFKTIKLEGMWRKLIGRPTRPYRLMIYGKPGSGKSTLALQYAGYLAEDLNEKVLYVAAEEGLSYTMKEKLSRLKITSKNLQIVDALPKDISKYDTVFIDSVNHAGYEAEQLRKLNKNVSFVFVFQTTKDGNFRGSQEYLHDVDTCIKVEGMNAYTEKNRFGAPADGAIGVLGSIR